VVDSDQAAPVQHRQQPDPSFRHCSDSWRLRPHYVESSRPKTPLAKIHSVAAESVDVTGGVAVVVLARDDLTAQLGPSLRKMSRAAHLWLGLPPAWQVTVSQPR